MYAYCRVMINSGKTPASVKSQIQIYDFTLMWLASTGHLQNQRTLIL